MPPSKLLPTILANTSPPVWLSTEARLAIRAFARSHNHAQVLELEALVGSVAQEFHEVHSLDPWFAAQPIHTFTALVVESDDPHKPIDLLVMVLGPGPGGPNSMLCVYTTGERPLGDDYHVARLLHETAIYASTHPI